MFYQFIIDIRECDKAPCKNGRMCTETFGSYMCLSLLLQISQSAIRRRVRMAVHARRHLAAICVSVYQDGLVKIAAQTVRI